MSNETARPLFDVIILDFDGVILDSVQLKTDLFIRCYDGEATPSQQQEIRSYQDAHHGIGRYDKFHYFERVVFGRQPEDANIARLASQYSSMLRKDVRHCAELPGAREVLKRFHGHVPLHLVSGTAQADLDAITVERDFDRYFDRIIGSPTRKEEAFSKILREAGGQGARIVAIGDSMTEKDAAEATGIGFVGIVARGEVSR